MMDGLDIFIVVLVSALLLGAGGIIGITGTEKHYREELVTRGHGVYCPLTGKFAFVGECDQ